MPMHVSEGNENTSLRKDSLHLYMSVDRSFIHKPQEVETIWMLIDG